MGVENPAALRFDFLDFFQTQKKMEVNPPPKQFRFRCAWGVSINK